MNLKVEYLREIEVIFDMALGNESGNQVGSIHEKNQRSIISWDYPFKAVWPHEHIWAPEICPKIFSILVLNLPRYLTFRSFHVVSLYAHTDLFCIFSVYEHMHSAYFQYKYRFILHKWQMCPYSFEHLERNYFLNSF